MDEKTKIKEMFKFFKKYDRPFEEKLLESQRLIEKGVSQISAVFWSGGKDSTILLHLILNIDNDIYVLFEDTGMAFPETRNYIQSIVKNWRIKNFYQLRGKFDPWHLPDSKDSVFYSCTFWLKIQPAKEFIKEHKIKIRFFGDHGESLFRIVKLNRGLVQKNSNLSRELEREIIDIYPMGYWSDEDIQKYSKKYDIQFNELYSKGYTRVACIFCPSQLENLKIAHPKLFSELLEKTGTKNVEELRKYIKRYHGHDIVKKSKKRVFI